MFFFGDCLFHCLFTMCRQPKQTRYDLIHNAMNITVPNPRGVVELLQAGLRAITHASLIPPIMSDMTLSVHQGTTACTISVAKVAYLAWQTATTQHQALQPMPVDGTAHTQSTLTQVMWRL
jgi:hypothetical protein